MKARTRLLAAASLGMAAVLAGGCQKKLEDIVPPAPIVAPAAEEPDAVVTERVKLALLGDPSLKGFDIAVVTTQGDVRLTGTVETQSQIDHADTVVRALAGVHSIHDELVLKK